jgi:hypothetical protein
MKIKRTKIDYGECPICKSNHITRTTIQEIFQEITQPDCIRQINENIIDSYLSCDDCGIMFKSVLKKLDNNK